MPKYFVKFHFQELTKSAWAVVYDGQNLFLRKIKEHFVKQEYISFNFFRHLAFVFFFNQIYYLLHDILISNVQ